ncbi:MAG: ABC transporter permease [Coriobacteriia bacterium]|nr:ABC transporter permease [Coriobacteriia bacterium]
MLVLLLLVSVLAFMLIINAPIDPLVAYIGPESTLSTQAIAQVEEHWGLNQSPIARYFIWMGNVLQGDFGMSMSFKRPVINVIQERIMYSFVLMGLAWTLSGVLGFAMGIAAGLRRGGLFDRSVKTFCLIVQSSPAFWIGLLVLSLFAVHLGWFPLGMAVPMGVPAAEVTMFHRIQHLILPLMTLTIVSMGRITMFTRQKLSEVMDSDFITFARARGLTEGQIVRRHAWRSVALPALTLQFASFAELFGGMALAETVFSYPGIGAATTAAALNADVPLLLGIVLITAVFVFCGNLIANLLYGVVDPRLRDGGSSA